MDKIKFKDKLIELPESYEEVSFEKFMALANCEGVNLKAVSILTGISEEEWSSSNDVAAYYYCFNSLSTWIGKGISEMTDREVKKLKYLSKNIELTDIGEQSVAQYEDLKILASKYQTHYESDPIEAMKDYYPLFVSIYLQPKTQNEKYDYSKAKKLTKFVNELPAPTVIGITNFFFTKLVASSFGIRTSVPSSSSWWKSWTLGLNNYTKRLAFQRHLTAWQVAISRKKTILKA